MAATDTASLPARLPGRLGVRDLALETVCLRMEAGEPVLAPGDGDQGLFLRTEQRRRARRARNPLGAESPAAVLARWRPVLELAHSRCQRHVDRTRRSDDVRACDVEDAEHRHIRSALERRGGSVMRTAESPAAAARSRGRNQEAAHRQRRGAGRRRSWGRCRILRRMVAWTPKGQAREDRADVADGAGAVVHRDSCADSRCRRGKRRAEGRGGLLGQLPPPRS